MTDYFISVRHFNALYKLNAGDYLTCTQSEIAKNNQGEEAAETKQNAEYMLSTHTCVKYKIPNKFAKVPLKADKTRQNAEYAPTINAWANIIKNNVDVETDEKDRVEEAIKTKQNAEYTLTAITCAPILKTKTPNKFAEVSLTRRTKSRRPSRRSRTLSTC